MMFALKKFLGGLDPNMVRVFLPLALRHPRYLRAFPRLSRSFKEAKQLREAAKPDLVVPPFLILSITSKCNLFCSGCYASTAGVMNAEEPLVMDRWRRIMNEAVDMGVFGFVIAGGEPFMYPDLLKLCGEFEDRFFIIVSNGTAIAEDDFTALKRLPNVAVLVSIEGGRALTDERRGEGTHSQAMASLRRLAKSGVITGASVTITQKNFEYWMETKHLDALIDTGIKVAAFMEYIPTGWDNVLMLDPEERGRFRDRMLHYRENKRVYIIHSPGDEEFFGGCVSAGRGFAHVTPSGDLTPCPVSDVATHNLTESSLKEALASPLFKEIRDNEHLLETEGMPCALFAHPDEVQELAQKVGAYRTS